jgi:tryptophan-rich sensory protein
MRGVLTWLGWAALTFAAAGVGAVAARTASGFYATLDRPRWAPPAWLFGPVWTVLYLAMATAAWLAARAEGVGHGRALVLYVMQLAANALWTWLFFAWRRGAWAFGEALVLWGLVALTLAAFWRLRPAAGALVVPYLLWVSFAVVLTWSVWRRNPDVL